MKAAVVLYAVALGLLDCLRKRPLRIVYVVGFSLNGKTMRTLDRYAEHADKEAS